MRILNLTQHKATPEQIKQGVMDLPEDDFKEVCRLLDFKTLPTSKEVQQRARELSFKALYIAANTSGVFENTFFIDAVMIGGAPWLMSALERALEARGLPYVYGFSCRDSVEERQADGSVVKRSVYRHVGFVGLEDIDNG